jgi:hypothetical protein
MTNYRTIFKTVAEGGDPVKCYFFIFPEIKVPQVDIYQLYLTEHPETYKHSIVLKTYKGKTLLLSVVALELTTFKWLNKVIDDIMIQTLMKQK